jgi:single-stranded DNA-binding protein
MNTVVLTGTVVAATERTVGQSGRTLTELRLAITRSGRPGEGDAQTVIPVTIWATDVGAAVREVPEGTPLTVVGRLQAREWNTRLYLELIGEHVTVAVTGSSGAAPGAPQAAAPSASPAVAPAAPPRPGGPRPTDRSNVPW